MRAIRPWFAAGLVASAALFAWSQRGVAVGNDAKPLSDSHAGQGGAVDRLREGTSLMEQEGRFQLTGDRLTFYATDGNRRLGALENLNLERIARLVGENPEQLEWIVSGVVTEFQGTNYLLVERAVLKTRPNRRPQPVK